MIKKVNKNDIFDSVLKQALNDIPSNNKKIEEVILNADYIII
jgi:hypothetical protein